MAWRMNKAREGRKHYITGFLRLVRIKCLPALIHHHPWMGYFNEQRRKPSFKKGALSLQSSLLSMPVDFLLMLYLLLLPSKGQGPIYQTTAHQGGVFTGHETTIALQSIHRFTSNQKGPKGNGAMTRPQKSAKSTSNRYVKQLVLGLSSRVSTLSIIGHASRRHHRSCKIDKTFVPPRIHAYQVSLSTCDGPPLCSSWRPG